QNDFVRVILEGGRDGADIFRLRHVFCSFGGRLLGGSCATCDQAERKQGRCEQSHDAGPSSFAGRAISHHATTAAESTVMALTRNTMFSLAPVAINPSAGLAIPWARSRKAV